MAAGKDNDADIDTTTSDAEPTTDLPVASTETVADDANDADPTIRRGRDVAADREPVVAGAGGHGFWSPVTTAAAATLALLIAFAAGYLVGDSTSDGGRSHQQGNRMMQGGFPGGQQGGQRGGFQGGPQGMPPGSSATGRDWDHDGNGVGHHDRNGTQSDDNNDSSSSSKPTS